ncbi:MAG: hypothetical protein GC192_00775 [Bacteroidetes bacterium]|nr:hypothetical protein [Bacteroidota bacterium]
MNYFPVFFKRIFTL